MIFYKRHDHNLWPHGSNFNKPQKRFGKLFRFFWTSLHLALRFECVFFIQNERKVNIFRIRTCPKRNSMTLLPKVAASGTKPETRPLGSVSLSFQTRPLGSVSLSFQTRPIERPLGSEILSSGSVSLSFLSLIFLIKEKKAQCAFVL
ncbi:Uncharacterized protein XB16_2016 [Leptospira santarosai]|uniref:Uncharacterized protein n=1 Tax=Leptospira santarosai TaxID=28183 RepID=A0A2P1QTW8_9LEPT|nr:Uncharacterized protein XB16_2016 [Leptospira santarosai]